MPSQTSQQGVAWTKALAVVFFLLVLFTVFYPIFQPVHDNRINPRSVCQSDMKQLGLAIIQYEQDADERMPPGVNAAGNGWAGQIYSFTKSTGVYRCPEDNQEGSYISYAENQNVVNQPFTFALPSTTVLLYETTTLNCDPSTSETNSGIGLNAPQDSKRHDQSTFQSTYSLNFLAMDGHVKYLKPAAVSNGLNAVRPMQMGSYVLTFAIK